jgi:hypothetical protein
MLLLILMVQKTNTASNLLLRLDMMRQSPASPYSSIAHAYLGQPLPRVAEVPGAVVTNLYNGR